MRGAEDRKHKDTMSSGFWAGVMLFVIVLVNRVGEFYRYGFPDNEIFQGFNLMWALMSALVGFFALSGKRMMSPRLAGLGILVLVFLSLYGILHYLFIRTYNEIVLSLVAGIVFGILTHFAASSGGLKRILE